MARRNITYTRTTAKQWLICFILDFLGSLYLIISAMIGEFLFAKLFTDEDIEMPTAGRVILAIVGIAVCIFAIYKMYRPSMALHYMDINNTNFVSLDDLLNWIEQQKGGNQPTGNQQSFNQQSVNQQYTTHANTSAAGTNNFVYFNCMKCGKRLRAPTGKGRIEVTCPVCKYKFDKTT